MIKVEINSISDNSRYNIFSSGVFFTKGQNDSIEFTVMFDDDFIFNVIMDFIEDDSISNKSELRLEANKEKKSLILKCVNFKDEGTGTTVPLEVATYREKKILLHIWAYKMSKKTTRKIEYTFYRER